MVGAVVVEVVVEEVICNRRERGGKGEETARRQRKLRTLRHPKRDLVGLVALPGLGPREINSPA